VSRQRVAAAAAFMPASAIGDVLRYLARYVDRPAEIAPDLPKLIGQPAITFPE
jgi:hypothetical protein